MRILVVSDIHGNWPALAAIDEPHDVCLCLGDLVDYGPDPARCVRWAMEHAHYAIRGNHDHGVAQGIPVAGREGLSLPDPRLAPLGVGRPRARRASLPAPAPR